MAYDFTFHSDLQMWLDQPDEELSLLQSCGWKKHIREALYADELPGSDPVEMEEYLGARVKLL